MTVTPNILIWVVEETLSDGSTVFNVEIPKESLSATSKDDAHELAEKIVDAINNHTGDIADKME